jgi:hypothetical protein
LTLEKVKFRNACVDGVRDDGAGNGNLPCVERAGCNLFLAVRATCLFDRCAKVIDGTNVVIILLKGNRVVDISNEEVYLVWVTAIQAIAEV